MGGLLRNTFGLLIGRKAPIALLTIFLTGVVPSLVADLSPTLRALQRLLLFLDHLLASRSISGTIQTQLLVHIITCVGHSSQDLSLEGNWLITVTGMEEDLLWRLIEAASVNLILRQTLHLRQLIHLDRDRVLNRRRSIRLHGLGVMKLRLLREIKA